MGWFSRRRRSNAAPSNAFLGADGRPYYEPDQNQERTRCCCIYVARGLLRFLLAISLIGILGLGAAALIAGPNKYMTYYVNKGGANDTLNFYKITTGYIRYEEQLSAGTAATNSVKHDLKDIDKALWIVGIVSAGVTGLSCLAAMWLIVSVIFEQVRRSCVCCYLPMGVLQIGAPVAYYVLDAIYISRHNGTQLSSIRDVDHISSGSVPWPDWAWYFMVGAGGLWLLACILTMMMPRPTKHIPTQYLQQDAARARGWNLASAAPTDPEAARLPGNMPSSAPVINDPVLEYRPKSASKKGWFGGKKSKGFGDENVYNRSPQEIADRYRPQGASVNIEAPGAYYNRGGKR